MKKEARDKTAAEVNFTIFFDGMNSQKSLKNIKMWCFKNQPNCAKLSQFFLQCQYERRDDVRVPRLLCRSESLHMQKLNLFKGKEKIHLGQQSFFF